MTAERRGVLAIAGAALLWSTGGIGIKTVAEPPLKIACCRSAFAAVALLALFRPRVRLTAAFLAATASYAACLTTFVVATKWTTAANAIFLQYSGVVWVLLLSPLVVDEPRRAEDAVAIVVALAGMALFFAGRLELHARAGDAVALLSGIFFAGVVLLLRRERGGDGGEAAVAWGNVLAALALAPFVLRDAAIGTRSLVILALLGTFQLAAAYVLFLRGIAHVPAAQASVVGMLEPVANPIWVFLLLGEAPNAWALAGGVIVLGAIAWRTLAVGAPVEAVAAPD
jgi:drug/metabolite transporter, DME family